MLISKQGSILILIEDFGCETSDVSRPYLFFITKFFCQKWVNKKRTFWKFSISFPKKILDLFPIQREIKKRELLGTFLFYRTESFSKMTSSFTTLNQSL